MQLFRSLLSTNSAGREALLRLRSSEQRRLLEQKLAEYEAMNPAQRELRLVLTDLRHYLILFLHLPESWREAYLSQLPEAYRPLVAERLKAWEELDPITRQELLNHEDLLGYLVRMENTPPVPPGLFLGGLAPERRKALEEALKKWSQTPANVQESMMERFKRFFHLSEAEQRQVLSALPPEQRQIPQKLLAVFSKLPADQREKYTAAFNRFLSLSPAEREQFLRNAMKWQTLTPDQRQMVREMVSKVPPLPPIPPGMLQQIGPSLGGVPAPSRQR